MENSAGAKHDIPELCERLFTDLLFADTTRKLFDALSSELKNRTVANIAPTFFSLTLKSLFEISYVTLARLYDTGKNTFTLKSLIDFAEANAGQFKCTAQDARRAIQEARTCVTSAKQFLKPVEVLRNNLFAHLTKPAVFDFGSIKSQLDPSPEPFRALIVAGQKCVNGIRVAFDGVYSDDTLLFCDDYENVFKLLKAAKRSQIQEYERTSGGDWPLPEQKADLEM